MSTTTVVLTLLWQHGRRLGHPLPLTLQHGVSQHWMAATVG